MRRTVVISLLVLLGLPVLLAATGWYLLGKEAFVKKQLHNLVLRQTGRSLELTGPMNIDLGSSTHIEAQDVRLSNASWAADAYLAQVSRLDVTLDLASFFTGGPVFESVQADHCHLALEEDADGANNWSLWPDVVTPGEQAGDAASLRGRYQLKHVQLTNCRITHVATERRAPLEITISELELQGDEGGTYHGRASGQLADLPLSMTGQFGPVQSIWQGGPLDLDLHLSVGKILLHSKGSFGDIRTGSDANVLLKFSGPEFARVTEYLALPPFSSDAFDFSLNLVTKGDMTTVDLDGDLGSFEISASGALDRIRKPTAGNLNLTTRGPDLQTFGQLFGLEGLPDTPFELTLVSSIEKGRAHLAPAVLTTAQDRLELNGVVGVGTDLKDSSLTIVARTAEIGRWSGLWVGSGSGLGPGLGPDLGGRPGNALGPMSLDGQMDIDANGTWSVQGDIGYHESTLKLKGTLGQFPQAELPSFDFDLSTPDASALAALSQVKGLPVAKLTAAGHFAWENDGIRFTSVEGMLARNQFGFSGFLSSANQPHQSKFKVRAKIPSTLALGLLFDYKDVPDQPLQLSATFVPAGAGLDFQLHDGSFGAIKLALKGHMSDAHKPELFTADGKIELRSLKLLQFLAPETNLPDLPMSFTGGLAHEVGVLRLRQAHVALGSSTMDIDGQLGVGPTPGGSSLKVSGGGPDLSEVLDAAFLYSLPRVFGFSGQLSSEIPKSGRRNDIVVQDFRLELGDMRLALSGTVDRLFGPKDMALKVEFSAPDASVLNALTEFDFEAVPLSVKTVYSGSLQTFSLDELTAALGASEVRGDLQFELGQDGKVSGALQSGLLDLQPWWGKRGKQPKPAEKSSGAPRKAADDEKIFPDELVMEVGKTTLDVNLDIEADRVDLGNAIVKDVHLGILLTDHQLRLHPFELSDAQGSKVKGQFELDASAAVPTMNLQLSGANIRIGMAAAAGQDLSTYPPAEVNASLQGSGKTWHQLASSVNGKVRIYQGSGRVATAAFDSIYSDFFTRLFSGLNLANKNSAYTRFDCGMFAADIVSGQVRANPVVIQTEHVTVLSVGTIDLESEKIDFNFQTRPRTGLGINAGTVLNPFIKVGGTLKHPETQFNAAGAVIGSGAAVATVGLSYVAKSFFDRFLSSRDPCGEARKKVELEDAKVK